MSLRTVSVAVAVSARIGGLPRRLAVGPRAEWAGRGARPDVTRTRGCKGTERAGSLEIRQVFGGMGAELNAGTGKETTSVYARVTDEHLVDAFAVMAHSVFRPALCDLAPERPVILSAHSL